MTQQGDGPESSAEDGIVTLRLRRSSLSLQWRSDGWWRQGRLPADCDPAHPLLAVQPEDWIRWMGDWGMRSRYEGHQDVPTWWMIYGELSCSDVPVVVLADGYKPDVHVMHGVWACDWVSLAQPAQVQLGAEESTFEFPRPYSLEGPGVDTQVRPGTGPRRSSRG